MSIKRATYIALEDPSNIASWSGTTYFMARALESAGFELDLIGPLEVRHRLFYKLKGKLLRKRGWDYTHLGEPAVLQHYARQIEAQIHPDSQIILSCGKPQLTYLKTNLPMLFFDDASVPAITTLYPGHTNFYPPNKRNMLAAERQVLEKCRYACYMSDWAAKAAVETYGREFDSKIKVIPIGANLEKPPTAQDIEQFIKSRKAGTCNLLFVGVDWKRKGGAIALSAAEELHKRGVAVQLRIVGCSPPVSVPDFVKVHGFISKKTGEGKVRLARLYQECHFFLLPTQAEAYGVAFVEACAYGLPSLGCRIGGVPTIIKDGVNGWLFPAAEPAVSYANRIESALQPPENYATLCRSTFNTFATKLNWKAFGETVRQLVDKT